MRKSDFSVLNRIDGKGFSIVNSELAVTDQTCVTFEKNCGGFRARLADCVARCRGAVIFIVRWSVERGDGECKRVARRVNAEAELYRLRGRTLCS